MIFSPWQLNKMRKALNRYRMRKGQGKHPRSWRLVLQDIMTSPLTLHDVPQEDEEEGPFKYEALRRFGERYKSQVLEQDKLEDVYIFLYHEGYLPDDEWQEEETHLKSFMAVHDYLSSAEYDAGASLSNLGKIYHSSIDWPLLKEDIQLTFSPAASNTLIHVEEVVHRIITKTDPYFEPESTEMTLVHIGFGVISTRQNLLFIFLRGCVPDLNIIYVQMLRWHFPPDKLILLRSGESTTSVHADADANPDLVKNIFTFTTTDIGVI